MRSAVQSRLSLLSKSKPYRKICEAFLFVCMQFACKLWVVLHEKPIKDNIKSTTESMLIPLLTCANCILIFVHKICTQIFKKSFLSLFRKALLLLKKDNQINTLYDCLLKRELGWVPFFNTFWRWKKNTMGNNTCEIGHGKMFAILWLYQMIQKAIRWTAYNQLVESLNFSCIAENELVVN